MRKVLLVSLVVFTAVVGGVLCITWFLQAAEIRRGVEQAIAAVNQQQTYLTHEGITTSGFPSEIRVTIHKPRFSGSTDEMLAALRSNTGQPPAAATIVPWQADIALDGSITIGINALSDRYTLNVSGIWRDNSKIGERTLALASQSPGDAVCTLQLGRSDGWFGALWNFEALVRNGEQFLADFRSFDCSNPGYIYADTATNQVVMRSGPQRLFILSEPRGEKHELRVFLQSADVEVTPTGDGVFAAYLAAIAPGYPFPPRMSMYGAQNMEVDFSYTGPASWSGADMLQAPLDLNLAKFNITNQVYTTANMLRVTNNVQGDRRRSAFTLKSESTYSDQYDVLLQDMVRHTVTDIYNSADPEMAPLQANLRKRSLEEWQTLVYPAVPKFQALGKTVLALNANYEGNAGLSDGEITLTALELSATPYGITGRGTARLTPMQIPAANITLVCTNCLQMVDDMAAYANRVQKIAIALDPDRPIHQPINPKLVEGTKTFLTLLAQPMAAQSADVGTYIYNIVSDTSGISVNGKRMDEVLALYNQHVAPFREPPPKAATP